MSHFYGVGGWPGGSWGSNGEVSGPYAAGGAQVGGWSTSWDEMASDSARMLRKQDASSQPGGQVNATPVLPGFGGSATVPAHLAAGYDKQSASYFELLPGQTWESALPATLPTKPQFSHSQQATAPNVPKPIAKPLPAPASLEWVEVTSSEGWTTTAGQVAPMTPTKQRPTMETPNSPSSTSQVPPSPNSAVNAANAKRHRDIEDELGHQDRYKTELCRSWHESGSCRYGSKCQFAHGAHELRPVMRHPKYKTEPCRSWVETRTCPYGRRCRFIHSDPPILSSNSQHVPSSNTMSSHTSMLSSSMTHLHPHVQTQVGASQSNGLHHGLLPSLPEVTSPHLSATTSPSSIMMMTPHHMYMGEVQPQNGPNAVSPARPVIPRLDASAQYAHQHAMAYHHHHQQKQQQQSHAMAQHHHQQPFGGWSTSSVPNHSPPYNAPASNLGFGMPLFNGSPPMSINSAEHLAAARASNAPWLSDTYQDEDDLDEYDPLSESLRLTPLIEQLNLHAEPVLPSISAPTGTTTPSAIARPTPIGSHAPIGSRSSSDLSRTASSASSPSSASSTPSPASSPHTESTTDSTEKSKKKKSSRLNIFQRLSSK